MNLLARTEHGLTHRRSQPIRAMWRGLLCSCALHAMPLGRYWSEEDPSAADQSEASLLQGALSGAEVETLLQAGTGWDSRCSGSATLHPALRDVAHDYAFSDQHVCLYLHRDEYLQQAQPGLANKLLGLMTASPLHDGGHSDALHVRCIELHSYAAGGGLLNAGHRDNGSSLTLSVLLSEGFAGGHFVTYTDGMPVVHGGMRRGDGLLFRSERLHNVCTVTSGVRQSLVVELWTRPANRQDRFK